MSYKTILVHVEANAASDGRIRLACDLARTFGGAVIGVGAEAIEQPVYAAPSSVTGEVLTERMDRVAAHLRDAEARFKRLARDLPQGAIWVSGMDYPHRVIALHARGADLIVMNRPEKGASEHTAASPADVVMAAGLPVLLAPASDMPFSGRYVVVGWQNSRECRRALGDALGFISRAERVFLLRVPGGGAGAEDPSGIEEVAGRLKRHGVIVETETKAKSMDSIAEDLQEAANRHGADLIVAGAYGHSRVREWALGGVTQALIGHASKYVLFSH
jgi:nucleotide-binding universal stress UspA family protein